MRRSYTRKSKLTMSVPSEKGRLKSSEPNKNAKLSWIVYTSRSSTKL